MFRMTDRRIRKRITDKQTKCRRYRKTISKDKLTKDEHPPEYPLTEYPPVKKEGRQVL